MRKWLCAQRDCSIICCYDNPEHTRGHLEAPSRKQFKPLWLINVRILHHYECDYEYDAKQGSSGEGKEKATHNRDTKAVHVWWVKESAGLLETSVSCMLGKI